VLNKYCLAEQNVLLNYDNDNGEHAVVVLVCDWLRSACHVIVIHAALLICKCVIRSLQSSMICVRRMLNLF
jgi:hypothetical protein